MPDRTRTCNPQLRRLMLYPLSYGHITPVAAFLVGAPRLELGTSCSQSRHATSCAMPRLNGRLIIYDKNWYYQKLISKKRIFFRLHEPLQIRRLCQHLAIPAK